MNMHVNFTPSQLAAHIAAKARAQRKIDAARRTSRVKQPAVTPSPFIVPAYVLLNEPETEKPLIPPMFTTSFSCHVIWESEYCPYSGGSSGSIRNRAMAEIATEWLKRFEGVSIKDLKSKSQSPYFVFPRQVIAHMISKQRPDLSPRLIGKWFGGRDRTTIIHGNNKIQTMIDEGTFDAAVAQWQANARGAK